MYHIERDATAGYVEEILRAKTIFANGPAGVFELEPFSVGTRELLTAVAEADAFSIVGGGPTVAAGGPVGLAGRVGHGGAGGGGPLNFLPGKKSAPAPALQH